MLWTCDEQKNDEDWVKKCMVELKVEDRLEDQGHECVEADIVKLEIDKEN